MNDPPPFIDKAKPLGSYRVLSERTSISDKDAGTPAREVTGLLVGEDEPVRKLRDPSLLARASVDGKTAQSG